MSGKTSVQPMAYSPADAAKAIGVSRSVIFGLLKLGHLPRRKIGRRTLILRADLDQYVASLAKVA